MEPGTRQHKTLLSRVLPASSRRSFRLRSHPDRRPERWLDSAEDLSSVEPSLEQDPRWLRRMRPRGGGGASLAPPREDDPDLTAALLSLPSSPSGQRTPARRGSHCEPEAKEVSRRRISTPAADPTSRAPGGVCSALQAAARVTGSARSWYASRDCASGGVSPQDTSRPRSMCSALGSVSGPQGAGSPAGWP